MRPEQKAAESLQRGTLCDEEPKEYVSRVATIIRRANAEHYGALLRDALGGSLQGNTRIRLERELAALEGKMPNIAYLNKGHEILRGSDYTEWQCERVGAAIEAKDAEIEKLKERIEYLLTEVKDVQNC